MYFAVLGKVSLPMQYKGFDVAGTFRGIVETLIVFMDCGTIPGMVFKGHHEHMRIFGSGDWNRWCSGNLISLLLFKALWDSIHGPFIQQ